MTDETVEVDRDVFDETVGILKDVETKLSSLTAYGDADAVEQYRKQLEDQDDESV